MATFEPILSVKSWQSGWNFLMERVGRNPSYCQIALPRVDSLVSPRHDEEAGSAGWHYPQISVYGFIGAAAASRLLSLLMSPLFLFFSNLLSSISLFSSLCVLSLYSHSVFIAMYLVLLPPSISPSPHLSSSTPFLLPINVLVYIIIT